MIAGKRKNMRRVAKIFEKAFGANLLNPYFCTPN
jgi:hypothetical protein